MDIFETKASYFESIQKKYEDYSSFQNVSHVVMCENIPIVMMKDLNIGAALELRLTYH